MKEYCNVFYGVLNTFTTFSTILGIFVEIYKKQKIKNFITKIHMQIDHKDGNFKNFTNCNLKY